MPITEVFDTTAVHAGARLRYWNTLAKTAFDTMRIEPASTHFHGRMQRRLFGSLQLTTVDSTPVAIQAQRSATLNGIYLMRNMHGSCDVYQHGRHAHLQIGDLVVLSTQDPYRIECSRAHRTCVLYVPGAELASTLAPQIALAHRDESCALLGSFLEHLGRLGNAQPGGNLLTTACTLLELTWPAAADTRPSKSNAHAWRLRLQQHVQQHLADPQLSAQGVARHFGISARYLQMIFAGADTSFSAYLLEQRLRWVAERLRDDRGPSICELALEAGFGDISHFCRCFRKRFGISASAYRRDPAPA
ncbi:helix-turn-helix domain-containing protein [Xanthomonas maliensis]|uniref:helix-turn-helix domain-containing protein n=1 Tax=Xanthomonas maliensis TaxID=1321368 RepID=UPI0003A13026|nr:helix-turn-helix domain-containing protein [Xanthomonas maliensis]KAB7771168.1 AraC family transcriptional regulator [Xanthomonas maliensis]